MHALARRRSRRLGLPVELLPLPAEELPVPSGSFDTVVCTYTLCSVQDPGQALREMRRVLRPGGRLLFAEHGLAPDAAVAHRQAQPLAAPARQGVHLRRRVDAHQPFDPAPVVEGQVQARADANFEHPSGRLRDDLAPLPRHGGQAAGEIHQVGQEVAVVPGGE
jgi:SAM-dependent methyltransferase